MIIADPVLNLNSIYRATEGEGVHIGTPQIFVRFQGCTQHCKNCDSKDTWDFAQGKNINLSAVIGEIYRLAGSYPQQIKRVSITGGDPLHNSHKEGLASLAKTLKNEGFYINIEVAGNLIDHAIFDLVDFISIDYKTPSTGQETQVEDLITITKQYPDRFQIKSVCSDTKDFFSCLGAYYNISKNSSASNFTWCLTPAYNCGESFPAERFTKIIDLNEENGGNFRVIGQQHKWIYGPDKKLV